MSEERRYPTKQDAINWHRILATYAKNELGLDHIELREYTRMGIYPHHVGKSKGDHFKAVDELMKVLQRHYPTQYYQRMKEGRK